MVFLWLGRDNVPFTLQLFRRVKGRVALNVQVPADLPEGFYGGQD